MFVDFFYSVCEFYNHIKLIVYEVIKYRQNNHIIPMYFYSKQKKIFFRNLSFFIKYNACKSPKLYFKNPQT